jgi:urea transporter
MIILAVLPFIFLAALIGTCWFAIKHGGESERWGAAIIFIGAVLSLPAQTLFGSHWDSPEYGLLTVDVLALIAFVALALRSNRFWPLWVTSFQVIAVVTHLATMADHLILPRAYSIAQPFWGYPMLLALVLGTRAVNKVAEPH